jgi:hypothetical protein
MNMDGKEFAEALLSALERRKKRGIQRAWGEEVFEELIRDALDPKPAEETIITDVPLPSVKPEFPQLRIRYGLSPSQFSKQLSRLSGEAALKFAQGSSAGTASEWVILQRIDEVAPFATWHVEPLANLERLKAEGVPEFVPARKKGVA